MQKLGVVYAKTVQRTKKMSDLSEDIKMFQEARLIPG